ncbi:hypothetical protein [Cellulomonas endophytica]|uniref:hypothetical protein n=1 Tax=Cellulomonas endophytica TaxID=2494735 RepID=UPI001013843C|nr:hypothetical protein [Cellulomonas endophytica]
MLLPVPAPRARDLVRVLARVLARVSARALAPAGVVLAGAAAVAAGLRLGDRLLPAVVTLAAVAAGACTAVVLAARARRERQRRRARSGWVEVVVRDPDREHRGLGPRWRSVRARPGRAALVLSGAGHGILADGPLVLLVLDVRDTGRTTRWRDGSARPGARILRASTPDGVVELAVEGEQVPWLRERLGLDEPWHRCA